MINKKNLPAIIIFLLIVSIGFVRINMINTKALSSLGKADENYEKVVNEFGDEFEEFIKDDSYIKIYENKELEGRTTVRIGDKEIFIKNTNIVIEKAKEYYLYFITGYKVVKEDVKDKLSSFSKEKNEIENDGETINVNIEIKEEEKNINNEENKLDKIVDDFLKNKE